MNKCVFSLVVSFMLFPAAAGAQSLDAVLGATDPALAIAARIALQDKLLVPQAAAPVKKSKAVAGPEDYVPLQRGGVYNYEYTSSAFKGSRLLRMEFETLSARDSAVTVTKTILNNTRQVTTFKVYFTQSGIQADGSPLAGPRLEMPYQLAYNQAWDDGPNRSRVAAANTTIKTAAGNYTGCIRILTRLGGNGGTINRYYAPGVGLVAEQLLTSEKQEMISLVSYQLN